MSNFLSNTFTLAGKSVLITGASSGFGEHFAKVMAKAGCRKMALLARRIDRLKKLAADLAEEHEGMEVEPITCDVSNVSDIISAFDKGEKALNTTFDVIVNNAGLGIPQAVLKVDEATYDKHVDVNLKGCWFVAQEAAKRLRKKNKEGSIINISSIYGIRVGNGHGVYAVTKAGLTHMTKAMALELCKHNIRVNSINPGYFLTEINSDYYSTPRGEEFIKTFPMQRLGEYDELNGVLLLLASDASKFMHGSVITVDGAHSISSL